MFAFAVIVFREVLEVALVLTILLVGTRGLAGRSRWIVSGILLGFVGAGFLAYFADVISNAMEGVGQEVFNAGVLLLAAAMIGWTIVWMKRTGKALSAQLKELGREISVGRKPLYLLATVTALSVLREGAEIVLLSHGLFAAGQSPMAMLTGGLLGFAGGAVVGFCIYFGLIKASTRHFFTVTTWLLILLSAGMVSKAIGYLSAAGYVPDIVYPVWDTSAILSESGFLGQLCSVMFGYSANPSGSQCLGYLATIAIITVLLKRYGTAMQTKGIPRGLAA